MKNEKPVSNLNESGNAPKNELGRSVSEKARNTLSATKAIPNVTKNLGLRRIGFRP